MHGVGAGGHVGLHTLGEMDDFIGCTLDPFFAVRSELELGVFQGCTSGVISDSLSCPENMGW
jgi:hypothetical protein